MAHTPIGYDDEQTRQGVENDRRAATLFWRMQAQIDLEARDKRALKLAQEREAHQQAEAQFVVDTSDPVSPAERIAAAFWRRVRALMGRA